MAITLSPQQAVPANIPLAHLRHPAASAQREVDTLESASGTPNGDGDGVRRVPRLSTRTKRALSLAGAALAVGPILGATWGTLLPGARHGGTPSPSVGTPSPSVGAPLPNVGAPSPTSPTLPANCTFPAGALPNATIDAVTLHNLRQHIKTVVLIVQENRPFDQYFAGLPAAGQPDVDVAPLGTQLPGLDGTRVGRDRARTMTLPCPNHDWNAIHRDYNQGKMDNFVLENASPQDNASYVMSYYEAADLPFYYALANRFVTSDRYFSSVLAGTKPNRLYLYAGTSRGIAFNEQNYPADAPTIFDSLTAAGVPWRVYSTSPVQVVLDNALNAPNNFTEKYASHIKPIAQYYLDAAAGTLPPFAIVEPSHGPGDNTTATDLQKEQADEHPPASAALGEHYVQTYFNALEASPQWNNSAFILTYDEGGGFYDHVVPPPACKPDTIEPMLKPTDQPGAFDTYGVRVPFILASPFARQHYVSHVVHDHTSVLRFLGALFDLKALTRRDANAAALLDMFDFKQSTRS